MGYLVNDRVKSGGIPMWIINPLVKELDIPFFIETGSAGLESTFQCCHLFKKSFTIELIEGRTPELPQSVFNNVVSYTGDSGQILPNIIDEILLTKTEETPQYAVFFLDAHYSEPVPNTSGISECPLMDELKAISRYSNDAILIIDDARLFLGHPPYPNDPRDWPSIQEIFAYIQQNFRYHIVTLRDDYILAFPDRIRDIFDKEWVENYNERYPDSATKLKSQVKATWIALQSYLK